jgi:hypothetical protein
MNRGTIREAKQPAQEERMPKQNVIAFSEDIGSMTFDEGLAFIERTRRQLDRYDVALPDAEAMPMTPEKEATVRRLLDEVETYIRTSPAST